MLALLYLYVSITSNRIDAFAWQPPETSFCALECVAAPAPKQFS